MRTALFMFTLATLVMLLLQFMCPKGGVWHHRRALLIGLLPVPPMLWNTTTAIIAGAFFTPWNVVHLIFGILFYCFYFRTRRLGAYAVKTATSTDAHQLYAILTLTTFIAAFLVPFLLRRFIE